MSPLPSIVLACPATLALILRAQSGDLPRTDYFDAWEALADPDAYQPAEAVRVWMQANWKALVAGQDRERHSTAGPELLFAQNPAIPAEMAFTCAPVLTEPWMRPFLDEFAKCGVITNAAKAGPINRDTVRVYRRHDPEFARAYTLAWEEYRDLVRSTIKSRSIDGWDEPVFGRMDRVEEGKVISETVIVGYIRKHDNRVLMRQAEAVLEEYASTTAGTKLTVNTTATANAEATATARSAPAKLKSLKDRKRRQNEKAALRATLAKN